MMKKVQGVVHGKTITFGEDSGFVDGEQVEVTVEKRKPDDASWGEGLRRCAGAWADSGNEEDDRTLEQIYQERKADVRPEVQ